MKKGDIGAVVAVFDEPKEAYEVEFLDEDGSQKGKYTLLPNELEKLN
ncbi:hypothetical protein MCOL2_10905 [Listeria fleischmannii FSL S10-1203]|uniref:DUF4926 domain-containing protein n=1 Tax=Listeria fleischmannii FSL S10-1203 TaxID=1265822 RepID=W7DLE7_9LIST|nr:hypothetical protein MCOL2_10905 [Listeria fleischmannii FSL S10-1203]